MMGKNYPQAREIFELTLDGSLWRNTPLGMAESFGFDVENWEYVGVTVTDRQTRKFMLVQVGPGLNLYEAKAALEDEFGTLPEGQWVRAFKDTFITDADTFPVGDIDLSWRDDDGEAGFPFIATDGTPWFAWLCDTCECDQEGKPTKEMEEDWHWLVFAPEDQEAMSKDE